LRRAVIIAIICATLLSALSLSASAQSQNDFYLHAGYLLDENTPTGASPNTLKLSEEEYYVWKTAPFPAQQSFPSGGWTASVWMNRTQEPTQYRVKLGVVDSSGAFVEHAHSFTPTITSPTPARYEVTISVGTLSVAAGESLAIGSLRQWQNGSYSPAAFIFFDSQAMPSSLNSPSVTTTQQTTTTTTQAEPGPGLGFAVVLMGIGIVVASAAGAITVTLAGRRYPQVFSYAGYYYCGKHRVPLYSVNGWSWCPVERRYLTKLCRSCGSSMRQDDRFCDRCGRTAH
jgi:hypothetical protein